MKVQILVAKNGEHRMKMQELIVDSYDERMSEKFLSTEHSK